MSPETIQLIINQRNETKHSKNIDGYATAVKIRFRSKDEPHTA
jgi:hypothetical protein